MSDSPDSAELVDIANEYRRLNRQIENKTQQLAALLSANGEAGDFPTDMLSAQNRRYSIEFNFKAGVLVPQERSVTVEAGTIFRCAYVESFVRALATVDDPFTGDPVQFQGTLPWNLRLTNFDYLWNIRDTGTDREWANAPQPSLFGGGGYTGPFWLPRRDILSGGSVISAYVDPFLSSTDFEFASDTGSIEQYVLQISFVGHEVSDQSEL